MVTVTLALVNIFLLSYLILRPRFAEWSLREQAFQQFEKSWGKIFFAAGLLSITVAFFAWWLSEYNPLVGLVLGTLTGFLSIAAYTDSKTRKIPMEISDLTTWVAFGLFATTVFTNANLPIVNWFYLPTISMDTFWTTLGIGALVTLLGVLGFTQIRNVLGWVSFFIAFVGLYIFGYVLISWLRVGTDNLYWNEVGTKLLITFTFLIAILLLDAFAGHLIGGADIKLLYAAGFALTWWMSSYYMFVFALAAVFLQIIVHILAKPLNMGELRTIKNGPLKQLWVNYRFKDLDDGIIAPTTHQARAVAFAPALVLGYTVGPLVVLALTQTV